jgi:hypothetical protein
MEKSIVTMQSAARARRAAQWATWQIDRSLPRGPAAPLVIECGPAPAASRVGLAWMLGAAGFLALGVVGAGLLSVGIERGLL